MNGSDYLPVNATCQWIMTAPVGKVFRIYLDVKLPLLTDPSSDDEYLRLYDGSRNASNLLANCLPEYKCSDDFYSFDSYFYSSGHSMLFEVKTGQSDTPWITVEYQAHVKQGKYKPISFLYGFRRRRGGGGTVRGLYPTISKKVLPQQMFCLSAILPFRYGK